jgi:hypothetical protein
MDGGGPGLDWSLGRSAPDVLNPVAFPVYLAGKPLLRERQRQCGVDMNCVDDDWAFDRHMELQDAVAAVRAAFDY